MAEPTTPPETTTEQPTLPRSMHYSAALVARPRATRRVRQHLLREAAVAPLAPPVVLLHRLPREVLRAPQVAAMDGAIRAVHHRVQGATQEAQGPQLPETMPVLPRAPTPQPRAIQTVRPPILPVRHPAPPQETTVPRAPLETMRVTTHKAVSTGRDLMAQPHCPARGRPP